MQSDKSELEGLAAAVPVGARFAEQLAVIRLHTGLALEAIRAGLDNGWIGPEYSPLGHERHVAAVERIIRAPAGTFPQALIVEGRHLLTIAALADEYFRPVHEAIARGAAANDNAAAGGGGR